MMIINRINSIIIQLSEKSSDTKLNKVFKIKPRKKNEN